MATSPIALKGIRRAYGPKVEENDKYEIWLYYVMRPLSFWPTWVFLKLGISANQTTVTSAVVGMVGALLIGHPSLAWRVTGAVCINLWLLLDLVDGNIARYRKTCSGYGDFLDTVAAYLVLGVFFLGVGIGAHHDARSHALGILAGMDLPIAMVLMGGWASVCNLLARLVHQKSLNAFGVAQTKGYKEEATTPPGLASKLFLIVNNLANPFGFLFPMVVVAALTELLDAYIVLWVVVNTMILAYSVHRSIKRAKGLESHTGPPDVSKARS